MTRKTCWILLSLVFTLLLTLQPNNLNSRLLPERGFSVPDQVALANGGSCLLENGPVTTDNGQFTIDLVDVTTSGQYVTFTWEICRGPNFVNQLSHWAFGLLQIDCYAEGMTVYDLVVDATVNGVQTNFIVGLDPTTGIWGVKWDDLGTEMAECPNFEFSLTFDTNALREDCTLGVGCVEAATKAGNQDVRGTGRKAVMPGFVTIAGPVCVCGEVPECDQQTAYAYDDILGLCFDQVMDTPRWGWTIGPLTPRPEPYDFPLYAGAGQCDITKGTLVGVVSVLYNEDGSLNVTYALMQGNTLLENHIHVGVLPLPFDKKGEYTVAPGQYLYALEDMPLSGVSGEVWVVAHAVVEICPPTTPEP